MDSMLSLYLQKQKPCGTEKTCIAAQASAVQTQIFFVEANEKQASGYHYTSVKLEWK